MAGHSSKRSSHAALEPLAGYRLRAALAVSACTGVGWGLFVLLLMSGGSLRDPSGRYSWLVIGLIAGGIAGVCAGAFTIWSRRRNEGEESIIAGIVTYYLGIFAFWLVMFGIPHSIVFLLEGDLFSRNFGDGVRVLWIMAFYGTFAGTLLVPFCFFNRALVWMVYCWPKRT